MGIEQQRKRLMTACHQWGDPPSPPQRPPQLSLQSKAREDLPEESTMSDSESGTDDLILNDMNTIVHPPQPISKSVVSSKEWTLENLLASGDRFCAVPRVSAFSDSLSSTIDKYERKGRPLIIQGWQQHFKWPNDMFHIDWFREYGPQNISVRNIHDWSDKDLPLSDFVAKSRAASPFVVPEERERLYGKDAKCPHEWDQWLHDSNVIPSMLLPEGSNNLLLNLPKSAQVETLMCYLGIGDTFTPSHKDLCASSGQNLMCYTENGGSSYWFMTESSAAPEATKYFHQLKQELDHETHVITIEELANAPFRVYVAEQKLGDMVLVPPRSCHQVVNHGGITVKTSWSRMTLTGLTTALYHELPIYRRVCRVETYRVKSTVHYTLLQKVVELEFLVSPASQNVDKDISSSLSASRSPSPAITRIPVSSSRNDPPSISPAEQSRKARLVADLSATIELFDHILVEEYSPDHGSMPCLLSSSSSPSRAASPSPSTSSSATLTCNEKENGDGHITCDFCGADIFQSFFECRECVTPDSNRMEGLSGGKVPFGDGFVVCGGCYAEGRSCKCESMVPAQCRPFIELLQDRRRAIKILQTHWKSEGKPTNWRIEQENTLLSEERLGIFRAACVLQQARKNKKETRACTLKGPIPSHHVPFPSALYCKKCHSTKCFSHILMDQRIHSADALLSHRKDDTHEVLHQRHQMSKNTFEMEVVGLLESEKEGSRPNFRHQLVKTAMTFGTCKPVNPTFMKLGWYDVSAQIVKTTSDDAVEQAPEQAPIDGEISNPLPLRSSPPSSPRPTPSDVPIKSSHSPMITEPSGQVLLLPSRVSGCLSSSSTLKTSLPPPLKRKRQLLDCVSVPSLASVIRRRVSSPLSSSLGYSTGSKESRRDREREDQDVDMSDPCVTSGRDDTPSSKPAAPATKPKTNNSPAISKQGKSKIMLRTTTSTGSTTTPRIQFESSTTWCDGQLLRAHNVVPTSGSGSALAESNGAHSPQKRKTPKAASRLPRPKNTSAMTRALSPTRPDDESERPFKKSRTIVDPPVPVVSPSSRKSTGNSGISKTGGAGPSLSKTTNSESSQPPELVRALNNLATNNSRKARELESGTSRSSGTANARNRITGDQSSSKPGKVRHATPTRVGVLEDELDSMKTTNSRLAQEVAELKQRMDKDTHRNRNNHSEQVHPSFPMEQIAQNIVRSVGLMLTHSYMNQPLHMNHPLQMNHPHGWHSRGRGRGPFRGRGHLHATTYEGQSQSGPSSPARRNYPHSRNGPYPRHGPPYDEDHGNYIPIHHPPRHGNTQIGLSDRNSERNGWSKEMSRGSAHPVVPLNGRMGKERYGSDERWLARRGNSGSKGQERQTRSKASYTYTQRPGVNQDTRRAGAATMDGNFERSKEIPDRGWYNQRNSGREVLRSRDTRAPSDAGEGFDRAGPTPLSINGKRSNERSDRGWYDRRHSCREVQSRDTQTYSGREVQRSRDTHGSSSTDMTWPDTCEDTDRPDIASSEMSQSFLRPGFPPSDDGGQESSGTISPLPMTTLDINEINDRGVSPGRNERNHESHLPSEDTRLEDALLELGPLTGDQSHDRLGSPGYTEHWEDNYDLGGDEPSSQGDGLRFEFSLKPHEAASIQKVQSTPEELNPWAL